MDDDTPNTQAEPVRACVLIKAPVKYRLRNYHAKTRLYAQVLAMDFYELPRHRTCVFDNPDTFRRECWQDGKLLAFITSALMATMPARLLNLVGPLPHEGTAMHTRGTGGQRLQRPGAVTSLVAPVAALRAGHVDSPTPRRTGATAPGCRTSSTATATATARATSAGCALSADRSFDPLVILSHHHRNLP